MKYEITVRKPTEKDISKDRPLLPSQEKFDMAFNFMCSNINKLHEGTHLISKTENSFIIESTLPSTKSVQDALKPLFSECFAEIAFKDIMPLE